jgi:hypothetical protein
MDLLAKIGNAYSDNSDEEGVQPNLAPEVDVSDMIASKAAHDASLFERTHLISSKPNHLSGVVEKVHINPGKFAE